MEREGEREREVIENIRCDGPASMDRDPFSCLYITGMEEDAYLWYFACFLMVFILIILVRQKALNLPSPLHEKGHIPEGPAGGNPQR